jgi:Pseudomonas avirulence D protein (AvrD)
MSSSHVLLLDDVDDYLGPGETRFFARGYQRSTYRVHDLEAVSGPQERMARARVDVSYPEDWSRKGTDGDLRPHLSTIDAYVLAVQLAELELAHRTGHDPQAGAAVVRRITLRAGGAPVEQLHGIPVHAVHLSTGDPRTTVGTPGSSGSRVQLSTFECGVGGFRVRCELEHPVPPDPLQRTGTTRFAGLEDVLGDPAARFHGHGFTRRRHRIGDVHADVGARTAYARVTFTTQPGPGELPGVTPIDGFVVNLQLAQVLMYELDGIARSESNTLWMMQTVLEQRTDASPIVQGVGHPVTLALAAVRQLPLRDALWRIVDLQGALDGVSLRSSFAHQLPQREPVTAG